MRCCLFALLMIAPWMSGCRPDFKRIADEHVRANLLENEKREAISFFEQQGRLFEVDETGRVDQQIVLPMLRRLNDVAPTEQWVLMKSENENSAMAVLVELPGDAATVDRMAEVVQEADEEFSGFILQQWGHNWLVMSLIDQKSYEILKKSNPNIDKQR